MNVIDPETGESHEAELLPPLPPDEDRLRRWRLLLGGNEADGTGCRLTGFDLGMDAALSFLYGDEEKGVGGAKGKKAKRGGGEGSQPSVARWLGDIRKYFPAGVVEVMQKDAIDRRGLREMLTQPEVLESVQPDVKLVTELMSLGAVIPEKTKATARIVVRKVVDELMKRLEEPMRSAVSGALNRAVRNYRPRHAEIDWPRTIRMNLKHYQKKYRSIIPERRVGHGRKQRRTQREIVLCIDQSGSMASSIVYCSIFGAVMASLPAVATKLVLFDTAVVDLSDKLSDPVDVLFGVQLGGGTDINQALSYCQGLVREPANTIFLLISDLIEGGDQSKMFSRVASIVGSGATIVALLALSDEGRPCYDDDHAKKFANLGVPTFACTPDLFPDLMAAAIKKEDIGLWAAKNNLGTQQGEK